MGATGNIVGTGLGLLLGEYNDRRQMEQQERLQRLQVKGQKELGMFNQELAMKTWEDTNYAAQRKQMEKAGLNVGLMYGMGGGGGATTHGGSAGNVSGGNAPVGGGEAGMGLQLGLAAEMQAAQIANIKANTEKTKVDTAKTGGIDTEKVGAEIKNLIQATQNAEMQEKIMEYDKQLKEIQANTAERTQGDIIQQINIATDKLIAETRSAKAKGNIDEATQENIIKGAQLANKATEAGITATQTSTEATKVGMKATEASTKQTEQNTKNLQQQEINQILANQMKANGIEPTDNGVVRMLQRWLGENGTNISTLSAKMKKIGAWMKGEYGEQSWKRLEELMKE